MLLRSTLLLASSLLMTWASPGQAADQREIGTAVEIKNEVTAAQDQEKRRLAKRDPVRELELLETARNANGEFVLAHHLVDEASTRMARFPRGMECMRERLHEVQREIRAGNPDAPVREPLTEREVDVLRLLQGSLSLSEIAGELFVSLSTVKTHLGSVHRKLGARNRVEVAAWAWESGLMA